MNAMDMHKTKSDRKRRLITIPMSHYCEKARWGLERLGLPYHEERHLQVFHYPRTWWVSRGPNVPVLIDGKQVISDSTRILRYLDRYAHNGNRLYPDDSALRATVEQWEDRFDEELGIESRRWVYYHMMPEPVSALAIATQGVPAMEKILAPLAFGLIKRMISKVLYATEEKVRAGVDLSRNIVAETDALLADGRRYLLGDRFTAADLALACMLAPFVMPPNYGIRLPTLDEVPESMRSDVQWFRQTRTGTYVLWLYEQERRHRA